MKDQIFKLLGLAWEHMTTYALLFSYWLQLNLPEWFFMPLSWTGIRADEIPNQAVFTVLMLISLYCWTSGLRLIYCITGRFLGLYSPNWYSVFLWVPWRPLRRPYEYISRWRKERRDGSEKNDGWISSWTQMNLVYKPGRIFIGRFRAMGIGWNQPVGLKGERHFFIMGGTGSGKTVQLVTILALHVGTSFLIDPKGQITRALQKRLSSGGGGIIGKNMNLAVLDPDGILSEIIQSACWNIHEDIDWVIERFGEGAAVKFIFKISEALIIDDNKHQPFFWRSARMFMQGVILFVHVTERPERRNLIRVRELVTQGLAQKARPEENPFDVLLFEMLELRDSGTFGKIIAARARAILESSENGGNSVKSTFRTQMAFLDLVDIQRISTRSTFRLADLKEDKLNLSVVANATDIQTTYSGWTRLLSIMTMYVFELIPGRMKNPCLMILDEFPSLGRIEALEVAAPKMRGYGIRLLPISQDKSSLAATYPDKWRGYLSNAEAVLWMGLGNNDTQTPTYLSKVLGEATREERVGKSKWWHRNKRKGTVRQVERELMTPGQITRFLDPEFGNMIVTRYAKGPFKIKREPYFKALPVFMYDKDPDHREAWPRALSRRLCSWLALLFYPKPIKKAQVNLPDESPDEPLIEEVTIQATQD